MQQDKIEKHRSHEARASASQIARPNNNEDGDALISRFKSSECISERGALDVTRVYVYNTPTKHIKEKEIRIHTSTRHIKSLDHMNVRFVTNLFHIIAFA
uniref:Uncharacterized protein n=1 Tax=Trichogramma kaykai TaxID=54128 RepID=A0ABD2VVD0_9HYME